MISLLSGPVVPLPWEQWHSCPDPQPKCIKLKQCSRHMYTGLTIKIKVSQFGFYLVGLATYLGLRLILGIWTRNIKIRCYRISPDHLSRRGLPWGCWGHRSPLAPDWDRRHTSNTRGSQGAGRLLWVMSQWRIGALRGSERNGNHWIMKAI